MRVCQWFPAAASWVGCETASAGQLCIQSCGSLQYRAALTSQSQWGKRQTRVPLLHSLQGSFSACGPPLSQSPPHFPKAQSPAYKAIVTASVSLSINAGGRELCFIARLINFAYSVCNGMIASLKASGALQGESGLFSQLMWRKYVEQHLFKCEHGLNTVIQANFECDLISYHACQVTY